MDKKLIELSALLIAHPYWWTEDNTKRFEFRNLLISSVYMMTGLYYVWNEKEQGENSTFLTHDFEYRYFSLQNKGKELYMTDILFALSNHPDELCMVSIKDSDTLVLQKRGNKEPVLLKKET